MNDVIDIASPEELFEHDGPLLAEDSERYQFLTHGALAEEPELPQIEVLIDGAELRANEKARRLELHVKNVMGKVKARQDEEVLQRFDSAMCAAAYRVELVTTSEAMMSLQTRRDSDSAIQAEQQVLEAMISLQAAQERMELRTRAKAALEAASERAATNKSKSQSSSEPEVSEPSGNKPAHKAVSPISAKTDRTLYATPAKTAAPKAQASRLKESDCKPDELQARIQKALTAAHSRHASEVQVKPVKQHLSKPADLAKRRPAAASTAAPAVKSTRRPQAPESLQDRISRVMAETQRRLTTVHDAPGAHIGENIEEQTTTASSYSATDSGSESGAECQSSLWWGPVPR